MKLYYLENNEVVLKNVTDIAFDKECDILCIGAGCAGIYAAVAAAREGMDTILLEYSENIGGMHIGGAVKGYYYGAVGGTYRTDDAKCREYTSYFQKGVYPETKQAAMIDTIISSGVKLFCSVTVTGVYFDDYNAVGVTAFDGDRIISIKSKMLIDATSDGYIIRMCPVNKRYGRGTDGKMVPFSVRTINYLDGGYATTNQDNGYVNQYDSREFSRKNIQAKAHICKMPPKGDRIAVAYRTGIREGLTFEGEDTLKYNDILLDKPPERILFYAYSDLDKHGHDLAVDEELYQNWWVISNLATVTVRIPVPMGCVVPKKLGGIVSAGRCFSCDSYSQSAVRMNRDMFRMGECIGIAASLAVKEQTTFLGVDYDKFLETAEKYGCYSGDKSRKFGFDYPSGDHPYVPVEFGVDKNIHLLGTETPGVAIWSCYISEDKEKTSDKLYNLMMSADNDLLKYNCAIALGIMNDLRCLPVLREIVEKRDCFYFKDCRRSNQFRSVVAVCLLGRIGTISEAELLEEIVFSENEVSKELYNTLKANYLYHANNDRNIVYFQMFTHACMALVKINNRCGSIQKFHERLEKLFADDCVVKRITSSREGTPAYTEIVDFIDHVLKISEF